MRTHFCIYTVLISTRWHALCLSPAAEEVDDNQMQNADKEHNQKDASDSGHAHAWLCDHGIITQQAPFASFLYQLASVLLLLRQQNACLLVRTNYRLDNKLEAARQSIATTHSKRRINSIFINCGFRPLLLPAPCTGRSLYSTYIFRYTGILHSEDAEVTHTCGEARRLSTVSQISYLQSIDL